MSTPGAPYTTLVLSRAEYLALLAALDDRVERCEQRAADDDDYWREARDVAAALLDRLDRLAA